MEIDLRAIKSVIQGRLSLLSLWSKFPLPLTQGETPQAPRMSAISADGVGNEKTVPQ